MKHRIIGVAGIAISLLLALGETLVILYNYGSIGLAFYHPYYGADRFLWSRIESEDWVGFILCTLWYLFLIIPWVQYFSRGFNKKSFGTTLTGNTNFLSVLFTMFNILMIIGSALLLSRPKNMDELGSPDNYWLYDLLFLIVYSTIVYVPWSIVMIVKNFRSGRFVESGDM